ncbi:MAG: hypothetical protein ACJ77D_00065 [Chloroflexota bacterium]
MFYGNPAAALFQVEHQHNDGTWSTLEPAGIDARDAAGSDPEREWDRGHVYICTACQERVRVIGSAPADRDRIQAG